MQGNNNSNQVPLASTPSPKGYYSNLLDNSVSEESMGHIDNINVEGWSALLSSSDLTGQMSLTQTTPTTQTQMPSTVQMSLTQTTSTTQATPTTQMPLITQPIPTTQMSSTSQMPSTSQPIPTSQMASAVLPGSPLLSKDGQGDASINDAVEVIDRIVGEKKSDGKKQAELEDENRQLREDNRQLLLENSLLKEGNKYFMRRMQELKLKLKKQVCFLDELCYIYMVAMNCLISI